MKRLTPRYKAWLLYRCRKGHPKRRQDRWRWATVANLQGLRLARVLPRPTPPLLCLDNDYEATIGFVAELRRRTLWSPGPAVQREMARRRGRIGWVRNYQDFSMVKKITPGAALIIAAEYDRARKLTGVPLHAVELEKWDKTVYATLRVLGFLDILGVENAPLLELPEDFHIQPLASEMAANSQTAVDQIVDLFAKAGGDAGLRFSLCGAVIDALENVKDHAYPADHFRTLRYIPNWWFTGAAHNGSRSLMLGIYDQGITIPVSLPRTFGLATVATAFASWFNLTFDHTNSGNDGQAIDAAMRLSASSTGAPHRGKGLAKIHRVVGACKGGQLRVVSRRGEYIYRGGNDPVVRTHPVSLPGTYVEISALF